MSDPTQGGICPYCLLVVDDMNVDQAKGGATHINWHKANGLHRRACPQAGLSRAFKVFLDRQFPNFTPPDCTCGLAQEPN